MGEREYEPFQLPDLLRQSVYSRLAGDEEFNDAERLATDPTFRLIGSPKRWDRSAALTSTLHWFETELLTREENLAGLMVLNRDLLAQTEGIDQADGVVPPATIRLDGRVLRCTIQAARDLHPRAVWQVQHAAEQGAPNRKCRLYRRRSVSLPERVENTNQDRREHG